MVRPASRARRSIVAGLFVLAGLCAAVPTASAAITYETRYQLGYIPPKWAWASTSAHRFIYSITTDTDHTACPAETQGYAGFAPAAGNYLAFNPCGYGVTTWYTPASYTYFHGSGYNPNQSTYDYLNRHTYGWQ